MRFSFFNTCLMSIVEGSPISEICIANERCSYWTINILELETCFLNLRTIKTNNKKIYIYKLGYYMLYKYMLYNFPVLPGLTVGNPFIPFN